MKYIAYAFFLTATLTAAAPAMAGGFGGIDLPHLTFPDTTGTDASQGCTSPATLTSADCQGAGG